MMHMFNIFRLINEDMENRIAKLKVDDSLTNEEELITKNNEVELECVSQFANIQHTT